MNATSHRLIIRENRKNQSPTEVYSRGFPFSVLASSLPPNHVFTDRVSVLGLSLHDGDINNNNDNDDEKKKKGSQSPAHFIARKVKELLQEDLDLQQELQETLEVNYRTVYVMNGGDDHQ